MERGRPPHLHNSPGGPGVYPVSTAEHPRKSTRAPRVRVAREREDMAHTHTHCRALPTLLCAGILVHHCTSRCERGDAALGASKSDEYPAHLDVRAVPGLCKRDTFHHSTLVLVRPGFVDEQDRAVRVDIRCWIGRELQPDGGQNQRQGLRRTYRQPEDDAEETPTTEELLFRTTPSNFRNFPRSNIPSSTPAQLHTPAIHAFLSYAPHAKRPLLRHGVTPRYRLTPSSQAPFEPGSTIGVLARVHGPYGDVAHAVPTL